MPAGAVIITIFFFLIPIIAIVANAMRNMKEREALHQERLKAIEMGQAEIPRALLGTAEEVVKIKRGRGPGVHGVVWAGIGLGLLASSFVTQNEIQDSDLRNFVVFLKIWAFPALFVGIGLIAYAIATRNGKSQATSGPAPTPR